MSSKKKDPPRSDPLNNPQTNVQSNLYGGAPMQPPPLPSIPGQKVMLPVPAQAPPEGEGTAVPAPPQHSTAVPESSQEVKKEAPLLWCTRPSADLLTRDYTTRFVKSGTYIDVRLAGAFEALSILKHGKGRKTQTFNELIEKALQEHADLLHEREDVVRREEMKIREKFHISEDM